MSLIMPTPYKDLELSFLQRLTLLRLKYRKINKNKVYANHKYDFLRKYNLTDYHPKNNNYLILSEKGKMYLRFRRKDNFRFWIPIIISMIALLGGYNIYTNSVIKEILQLIASAMKTIAENLGAFF